MSFRPQIGVLLSFALVAFALDQTRAGAASHYDERLRVALVGFRSPGSESGGNSPGDRPAGTNTDIRTAADRALRAGLERDKRTLLVEDSLVEAAIKGIGYDGSTNLRTVEARRLGAAIGCDFFVLGRTETVVRSEKTGDSHPNAYAGVFIVDGRSGRLVAFDFVTGTAGSSTTAIETLCTALVARCSGYTDGMIQDRNRSLGSTHDNEGRLTAEIIEDIPEANSARALDFKPPEFINRVRPQYTESAELADITATVEASVVFLASGEVGQVEITRWAGFGLDDSSAKAIRQLRFKPATRAGKPVSVRATVQHNFRRVAAPAQKST